MWLLSISHISGIIKYLFVTGLFHLAKYPQDSSILQHVSQLLSFIRLNNIPVYIYIYIHILFIYSSADGHLVASTFWLLRIIKYVFFISKRMTISRHCIMNTMSKQEHRYIWGAPSSPVFFVSDAHKCRGKCPSGSPCSAVQSPLLKSKFRGRGGLVGDLYLVIPNLYSGPI